MLLDNVTAGANNRQGRLRAEYISIFTDPHGGYKGMVDVITSRVPPNQFVQLLSQYRAVLSPPGRGYDCFRTWQALAVGSIPMVVKDDDFDPRLFEESGACYIPKPAALTPLILAELLDGLHDPAPAHGNKSQLDWWQRKWESYLQ